LTILGAGVGGFLTAPQSTTQLQHEANVTHEAWLAQTQLVAAVQTEQTGLIEHIRELKQALSEAPPVVENPLWSELNANRTGSLSPELRERLLAELGFNWQLSPDFIVVTKDTVRDMWMTAIQDGKLTDIAATVLALTPGERGQVEAAMQRVQSDFTDWASLHIERSEPKDDVVAQYTLPSDPAMSISNNFATGLSEALGQERAELILPTAGIRMRDIGIREVPTTLIVKRYLAGGEQRLKVDVISSFGTPNQSGYGSLPDLASHPSFPPAFLPIFPNGWADVAKREGFELPKEAQKK